MMMSPRVAWLVFGALTLGLVSCARGPAESYLEQGQGNVTDNDDSAEDGSNDDRAEDDSADDDDDGAGDDAEADLPDEQSDDDTISGQDAGTRQDAGADRDGASQLVVPPGKDAAVDAGSDAAALVDAAADAAQDASTAVVDAGPPCTPGIYAGQFQGSLSGPLTFGRADVTGAVTLQVTSASAGRTLQIQSGALDGVDDKGNAFVAKITGTIDCGTRQLVNGTITNGDYKQLLLHTAFIGVASASYSSNPALMGQMQFQNLFGQSGGSASWSAYLQ